PHGQELPQVVLDGLHVGRLFRCRSGRLFGFWLVGFRLPEQGLGGMYGEAASDDLLAERDLPGPLLDALEHLGMAERDLLDPDRLLHLGSKIEQTDQIADGRAIDAKLA